MSNCPCPIVQFVSVIMCPFNSKTLAGATFGIFRKNLAKNTPQKWRFLGGKFGVRLFSL